MRPGRLRQVLDRDRDVLAAFDQHYVADPERLAELIVVRQRVRLVAGRRCVETPGHPVPNPVEHRVTGVLERSDHCAASGVEAWRGEIAGADDGRHGRSEGSRAELRRYEPTAIAK